jgi:hypothetical protein
MSSIKVISTRGFRDSGSKLTICLSNVGRGVEMVDGGAVSQAGRMLLAGSTLGSVAGQSNDVTPS